MTVCGRLRGFIDFPNSSMTLKALIFDVDGTLADTERDGHRIAFNETFHEFGLDWCWSEDLYAQLVLVTGGKERIRNYVDNYLDSFSPPRPLDDFIAEMHARKTQRYVELVRQRGIPLRNGVERLLREARTAGLKLAIATTTTVDNVVQLLSSTLGEEALDWFDVIGAGEIVPHKKPAPDIYTYVLEKLDLEAGQCLALEDSNNGLRSAHGAGLKTVITQNDYTEGHDFSGALLVVDQLGEPDQPCIVITGDMGDSSYVDVALLKRLHEAV